MNKKLWAVVCSMVSLTAVAQIASADDIKLGIPTYGGNGCPAGSAQAVLSDDQKALTVLFDSYSAEAGGSSGRRVDRKSCNVAIPVHVPHGYSFSIVGVDYRGFTSVPRGGQARFNVEYFFAGSRGPSSSRVFNGPLDSDYTITNRLGLSALVWSACGADTILRSNSSMMAQSNNNNDQTLASVDSVDIKAGVVYQIQWKRCN